MKLNQQHNDRCAGFEGFFLSTMVLESGPIEATANPKTPHARKTLSELRAHLGQIVLSAKDLGDLTEALDEALENCIFAEYVARAVACARVCRRVPFEGQTRSYLAVGSDWSACFANRADLTLRRAGLPDSVDRSDTRGEPGR